MGGGIGGRWNRWEVELVEGGLSKQVELKVAPPKKKDRSRRLPQSNIATTG